jgi:hypothetical protein
MAQPFGLFSTEKIRPEDFLNFLGEMGGVAEVGQVGQGRISRGTQHVWLHLNPKDLRTLPQEILDQVVSSLGGSPQTSILMEIGREPGSDELAIRVAKAFAGRWLLVGHDLKVPGHAFSRQNLLDSMSLPQGGLLAS